MGRLKFTINLHSAASAYSLFGRIKVLGNLLHVDMWGHGVLQQVYSVPYNMSAGHSVAQLTEALRYKPEGRGYDFRWFHWNFALT